ncbi:MAG: serine O-acetyltransferase [Deltaproteobacteria bacterium]|nr:serine O-acetyltransferase [Deltaproteobacteria bacterium]MBW1963571.1 serine O-acetyltransferase [Deltaproteobacteria bacterium]MBW1994631.1 serine O-acetyltransferase [Deltaproteobacteria bacterium]MBW2150228.1 serine O-acetyltransferase [Deltaproteobacteria bacterium]
MFKIIRQDIDAVFERDPAARNVMEVLLCYPGLHAIWGYRLAHWLWRHGARLLARWVSHVMRGLTGIEIHPGARIGPRFFIDHGMGVVIGETTEIGANVTLYQGVTLGGTSLQRGKRHPTLEDEVVVGAGARILGPITVGRNSRIGANAVVVKPVRPNSIVVGIPGREIERNNHRAVKDTPDLNHDKLPDVIWSMLDSMIERIEQLEKRTQPVWESRPTAVSDEKEVVLKEDFSI